MVGDEDVEGEVQQDGCSEHGKFLNFNIWFKTETALTIDEIADFASFSTKNKMIITN